MTLYKTKRSLLDPPSSKAALILLTSSTFLLLLAVGGPPTVAEGRMTGGGSVFTNEGARVTHGFTLHCNPTRGSNSLEINWGPGKAFHLETIEGSACFDNPLFEPRPPVVAMDTIFGHGRGRFNNGTTGSAEWTFTDHGEPGSADTARIFIFDANGVLVLTVDPDSPLTFGNHQAHKEIPAEK